MELNIDPKAIAARNAQLDEAKDKLLEQFVGIDGVIHDLIDAMRIWYVMPDVLVRPVIINLWGMTGVGKTDLVRKLVKYLQLQDRFAEFELSNVDMTLYQSSVTGILESHQLNDTAPKVLFFDEMQRFNTVDEDGKSPSSLKFADFWELLSDGRLAKRSRDNLEDMLFDFQYTLFDNRRRRQAGEDVEEDSEIGHWIGRDIKRRLSLKEDVDELAALNHASVIDRIRQAQQRKTIYEPVDHSRTLIIVSGNLDEAFTMSGATDEADIDADIFHAFTRKITMVDIKRALSRRFKPEQVARFGNVHLIYRSLSKSHYETIIAREVERVRTQTRERFGVDLSVSDNVQHLIYRNGVFPAQGVRPVLSSVTDILETNLSKLLFTALTEGQTSISVDYDADTQTLKAKIGDTQVDTPFTGRLDKARQRNRDDLTANIAVHESGHAVAYMTLFGVAPLQLTSRVTSIDVGSFMFPHEIIPTRQSLIHRMQVFLAGGLAEELVFGEELVTTGCSHDREMATQTMVDYYRRYGFSEKFQANYTLDGPSYLERKPTDEAIEVHMRDLVKKPENCSQRTRISCYPCQKNCASSVS